MGEYASGQNQLYWSINPTRTVPALDVGDRVIGDSSEIVHYLDHTHPSPPLDVPGNTEAEAATGQVFNVFSAWAKNKGVENEEELRAKFTAELEKIEQYIAKGPGPLLCGQNWSIADCALVPRLYHITTITKHYMKYDRFDQLPNLSRYMQTAFSSQVFKATDYPAGWILTGWAKYFR